ncbi:AraC family ligand binding domain-containing protein [Wukongibacter baidiensis]|uniref:AraC family transcriptional regulator n=1 Tax=Wukongibacter baidiensis TaxID=1723361 RepID=UPI003D7FD027
MLKLGPLKYKLPNDIKIYHKGREDCKPGKFFGPFKRDHYLIHIIINGEGTFEKDGNIYKLKSGQGFLIKPDEITKYKADIQNPWSYYWFGFHGKNVEAYLDQLNIELTGFDVSELTEKLIKNICDMSYMEMKNELYSRGMVLTFLGSILKDQEEIKEKNYGKNGCIDEVCQYLYSQYSSIKKMEEVARAVQMDQEYISRKFKKVMGINMKEYLLQIKIENAKKLLEYTDMSIAEIGDSVGYPDPFYFSKMFKKKTGQSPKGFRKEKKNQQHNSK